MAKNYRSELVGTFGDPIDENPTGVMEEAAFAAKGLDWRYITMRVKAEDLGDAMKILKAANWRGLNTTIPHKVAVLKYLDELSPAAEIIGAVNTIINRDGKLFGENTDGKGFLRSMKDAGVSVQGKTMTVLGAGGASRAISVESALAGAKKIHILNIEKEMGEEVAELINTRTDTECVFHHWVGTASIPAETEILVNATSVGLYPNVDQKPDIDYDGIRPDMVVQDVIFNDPNSLFLQEAAKRGAKTVNGLGMLVCQGATNFELWTGVEAPFDVMYETLKQEFGLQD